jgi:segregation and condensation protein B
MSDEQTPDVIVDAADEVAASSSELQSSPDDGDAPGAVVTGAEHEEAPAPVAAKGRRGKGRGADRVSDAPAADAAPQADDAGPASEPEGDAEPPAEGTGDDANEFDGELRDPELFDPEEVANAPRAPHPLKPVVEALIFASPEPLTVKAMVRLLEEHTKEDIEAALTEVHEAYAKSDGLQLVEVAGGYQIVTRPELYEWVRRLFKERTTSKLSVQALETLAVIAYKQPVTSGEIAEIRGVSATTGVLNTLLDRKLVKIVGRKQVVGRPFMYGTTREFLDKFGLRDLSDLPKVEDMSEALGFDLPSPVDETDGISLPFDESGPVTPLLFDESGLPGGADAPNEAVADEAAPVLGDDAEAAPRLDNESATVDTPDDPSQDDR